MRGFRKYNRCSRWLVLNLVLTGIWAILMGIFFIGMPKCIDDLAYIAFLKDYQELHGTDWVRSGVDYFATGFPLKEISAAWADHYANLNGRLANMAAIVLTPMPKWVGSSISLLLLVISLPPILRLSGSSLRRGPGTAWAIAALTFFLPWHEHLGSLDYQLNYVWPAALALWLLTALGKNRSRGLVKSIPLILGAALLGAWHEGFGLPVAAGLAAAAALKRDWRNPATILSIFALLAGGLFLWISPGWQFRLAHSFRPADTVWFILDVYGPTLLVISVMGVLALSSRRACHRIWELRCNPIAIVLAVSALASLAMAQICGGLTRAAWWAQICAVIALTASACFVRSSDKGAQRVCGILGAGCCLCAFLHLAAAATIVIHYRESTFRHMTDWRLHGHRSQFGTIKGIRDYPWAAGRMPDDEYPRYLGFATTMYTGISWPLDDTKAREKYFFILPPSLRHVTCDSGLPSGSDPHLRRTGDDWFVCGLDPRVHDTLVEADFGSGYVMCPAELVPFVSEADRKVYHYVALKPNWFVARYKKVRSLRLLPAKP